MFINSALNPNCRSILQELLLPMVASMLLTAIAALDIAQGEKRNQEKKREKGKV